MCGGSNPRLGCPRTRLAQLERCPVFDGVRCRRVGGKEVPRSAAGARFVLQYADRGFKRTIGLGTRAFRLHLARIRQLDRKRISVLAAQLPRRIPSPGCLSSAEDLRYHITGSSECSELHPDPLLAAAVKREGTYFGKVLSPSSLSSEPGLHSAQWVVSL